MYQAHDTFIQPRDLDQKVWRYIDFTKLISVLDKSKLFFSRADMLGDPFEGSLPRNEYSSRERMLELLPEISRDYGRRHLDLQSALTKCWTIYTAINCWHLNSYESAAMWVLYLKSNEGIAIQSTYRKLLDSLVDEREIFVGKVNYIDYDNEIFLDRNALAPLVYKRKSFEHEREVRAIITNWPKEPIDPDSPTETLRSGIEVDVDLKVLIENIYLSPDAPDWLEQLVRSVVQRFGYNFQVVKSQLNDQPLF